MMKLFSSVLSACVQLGDYWLLRAITEMDPGLFDQEEEGLKILEVGPCVGILAER